MNVLSLFDGISCGKVAFERAGIPIEKYYAYEIDKYAMQVSESNHPDIIQCGDVFDADFTRYEGIDYLIGGSPCTYWSIAQKNNRETEASGMGWELFSQYVRAIREAKPRFFLYENNKSMSKQIRASIDEAFGFGAVLINSALVSAQNRQRLYWVGRRNADGTYSKIEVEQPEDRGILLRDILESGVVDREKTFVLKHQAGNPRDYFKKHHTQVAFEPVRVGALPRPNGELSTSQAMRIYGIDGKSVTQSAGGGGLGGKTGLYAVPVNPLKSEKSRCVTAGYAMKGVKHIMDSNVSENPHKQTFDAVAVPVCLRYERTEEGKKLRKQYEAHEIKHGFHEHSQLTPREDGKTNTISTVTKDNLIAEPINEGYSSKNIYEVKDGQIFIGGKQYPIKLPDGFYIIRKLTVNECCRLQTLPDDYCRAVSNSQAYKGIGNGWTVDVIAHLFTHMKGDTNESS